jgi:hypothetical protein
MFAGQAVSWSRESFWRSTIAPCSSWPIRWNVFLPMSIPNVPIVRLLAPFLHGMAPCASVGPWGYAQEHGRSTPFADSARFSAKEKTSGGPSRETAARDGLNHDKIMLATSCGFSTDEK